jgi:hypothetical protein
MKSVYLMLTALAMMALSAVAIVAQFYAAYRMPKGLASEFRRQKTEAAAVMHELEAFLVS